MPLNLARFVIQRHHTYSLFDHAEIKHSDWLLQVT